MNAHATREQFVGALRDYINQELPGLHARMKRAPNVGADTPLFATGLIDSLAILYLIAWVETAIGRRIAIEEVVMSRFQTIDAIARHFWQPAAA